jgi:protein gp37
MSSMWNPWRGCHKYSTGCKYCYIHKADSRKNIDTGNIVKTDKFYAPVNRKRNGEYKIKSGSSVYLCFTADFLIAEADEWRRECWEMIRERSDLDFLFLTKRIDRFSNCIPDDWGDGYDNVRVGCTIENQQLADYRLNIFCDLPIKHKIIICQPLLENIDIEKYLKKTAIKQVVVGGESDRRGRPLDYDWVLAIREQCIKNSTSFVFRQCGTNFIKDNKTYVLPVRALYSQAGKANIDVDFSI